MEYFVDVSIDGSFLGLRHTSTVRRVYEARTKETFEGRDYLVPFGKYAFYTDTGASTWREHKRGIVAGFSERSRSRLNKKIAMLDRYKLPLFVTLTYGAVYPKEMVEYKRDLHWFFTWLKKKFPDYGAIWKLEFQERGAPHFHLFLWGFPFEKRHQIVKKWYQIAGRGDLKVKMFHQGLLSGRHCVEKIRSRRGVLSYAAKYMGKVDTLPTNEQGEISIGRVWGVVGLVPFSRLLTVKINLDQALEFRRRIESVRGKQFAWLGFWFHGADAVENWIGFLWDVLYTPPEPDPPDWDLYVSPPLVSEWGLI